MFLFSLKFSGRGRLASRRSGFILISVLMLSVVFISCAAAFAWFSRLQTKSVLRERVALTNRSMAKVLTGSVMKAISQVTNESKADSPLQPWFQPFVFPADALGTWVIQVRPLDDKIPLRALFLPDGDTVRNETRRLWDDLWERLGRRELAILALDFMDKNKKPRVGGVERENFINRSPLDLSEFLLLPEMTPELLYGRAGRAGMADYCTLWSAGRFNLNVTSVEVLELLPGLDRMLAHRIDEFRRRKILQSMSDMQAIPGFPVKSATQLLNLADFKSRYFELRIQFLERNSGGMAFNVVFDVTGARIVRWEEL